MDRLPFQVQGYFAQLTFVEVPVPSLGLNPLADYSL
jgi:hypothetical protein